MVRKSILEWRDEALAGFVSQPVATKTTNRSALAALRQFFDLSPLWLKGATALAVVAFCVLAAFAFVNLQGNSVQVPSSPAGIAYTQDDVNRIVKEALAQQKNTVVDSQQTVAVVESPKPKKARQSGVNQFAKSRRPLSRAEREQLAADLRLLSTDDDASIQLLEDRINQ